VAIKPVLDRLYSIVYKIVYKLNMATVRKQKVGKYTYWQIVESRRFNGKPRPIMLAHHGEYIW